MLSLLNMYVCAICVLRGHSMDQPARAFNRLNFQRTDPYKLLVNRVAVSIQKKPACGVSYCLAVVKSRQPARFRKGCSFYDITVVLLIMNFLKEQPLIAFRKNRCPIFLLLFTFSFLSCIICISSYHHTNAGICSSAICRRW